MPKKGLHAAKVGTIVEKVRRKAVPELVRREVGWQSSLGQTELEEGMHCSRR